MTKEQFEKQRSQANTQFKIRQIKYQIRDLQTKRKEYVAQLADIDNQIQKLRDDLIDQWLNRLNEY